MAILNYSLETVSPRDKKSPRKGALEIATKLYDQLYWKNFSEKCGSFS